MNRFHFILEIILLFCLMVQSSWADTAYVTDSFRVTFRTGPSIENRIIATLSSGQPLDVLNTQGDWSHVRILGNGQSNKEGWILSRYLTTRFPWELKASDLAKENAAFKKKLVSVETKLNETVHQEQNLTSKLQESTDALQKLRIEFESLREGATDYLKIKARHGITQSKLETSQKKVRALTEENIRLKSSQRNKWFVIGALVLLCGLVIGLVLGGQKKSRRSTSYY